MGQTPTVTIHVEVQCLLVVYLVLGGDLQNPLWEEEHEVYTEGGCGGPLSGKHFPEGQRHRKSSL